MKTLILTFGILFLVLGIIGIFTPILPTTPFVLLAAYCFSKSSEKFHSWLVHHPLFGEPVKNWQKNGAIAVKAKILAISMLALSAGIMFLNQKISAIPKGIALGFLLVLALYILSRPSGGQRPDNSRAS